MSQRTYDDEEWEEFVQVHPTVLISVTVEGDKKELLTNLDWGEKELIYFVFTSRTNSSDYKYLYQEWFSGDTNREFETLYILADYTQTFNLLEVFNTRALKFSPYTFSKAYIKLSKKQIEDFLFENEFNSEFFETILALRDNQRESFSDEKPVKFLASIIEKIVTH